MLIAEISNQKINALSGEDIISILNDYRHPMFEQVYDVFVVDKQMVNAKETSDE